MGIKDMLAKLAPGKKKEVAAAVDKGVDAVQKDNAAMITKAADKAEALAPAQMKGTIESAEEKAKAAVLGLDKERVKQDLGVAEGAGKAPQAAASEPKAAEA